MAVPISQMWTVATYVLKKRFSGNKRYPLVLMLEPLFRCNLACAGCGKVQYPPHILKKQLKSAVRRWFRFRAGNRCCIRRLSRSSTASSRARSKFTFAPTRWN